MRKAARKYPLMSMTKKSKKKRTAKNPPNRYFEVGFNESFWNRYDGIRRTKASVDSRMPPPIPTQTIA